MLHLETDDDIDYPCSDGKPLGETDLHRRIMIDLIETLEWYFAQEERIYVSGNILLYYEKGSRKHVSPDVLVTLGLAKGPRDIYALWREGKAPNFVLEVTSKTTRSEDVEKKRRYAQLGVQEYLMFDPTSDYLKPRFQAFLLGRKRFARALVRDSIGYASTQLGLTFRVVENSLRIFETATGRLLLTPVEQARRAEAEARRAESEARRAESEARRAEEETRRAEAEARRAEAEALRAESAVQRARASERLAEKAIKRAELEAESNQRYRQRLRELGVDPDTV